MSALKKLGAVYNKLEEYALVYTLAFCVVIIFLQVIMRYAFNSSLSWSEEAAKYLFVWLIWLGTSIAARDQSHIALEIISGRLGGRSKYVLAILVKLIWLAMCIFLAINGWEVVSSMMGRGKTASAMPWLKVWLVYLAIPVSQGILSIRLLLQIGQDVKSLIGVGTPNPHEKGGA